MTSMTQALANFIQDEVVLEPIAVEAETDLLLTGAVDSLGVIRITHWMEETAGVSVDPADVTLENFQTVSKMAAYLESRTGA